jgi:hypothetical protein
MIPALEQDRSPPFAATALPILERFRENHGDKRTALMLRKALQAILDKKSPTAARNWKKALRGFINHCLSLDLMAVDPLAGVSMVKVKSNGHHPWEPEESVTTGRTQASGDCEKSVNGRVTPSPAFQIQVCSEA